MFRGNFSKKMRKEGYIRFGESRHFARGWQKALTAASESGLSQGGSCGVTNTSQTETEFWVPGEPVITLGVAGKTGSSRHC